MKKRRKERDVNSCIVMNTNSVTGQSGFRVPGFFVMLIAGIYIHLDPFYSIMVEKGCGICKNCSVSFRQFFRTSALRIVIVDGIGCENENSCSLFCVTLSLAYIWR